MAVTEYAFKKVHGFTGNTNVQRLSGATALILGEDVTGLEQELCRMTEMPYCVSVPDAELGLYLVLQACGVEQGDQILCSGLAPAHVVQAILWSGAVPVLVDINPNTFNLDPYCLEYAVKKCIRMTSRPPKMLIATDAFGLPCNYRELWEICDRYGIVLVEDMAESLGAEFDASKAGSFGRFAVAALSFNPVNLAGEEGAAVLAHREEDMAELRGLLKRHYTNWGDFTDIACKNSVRAGMARENIENFSSVLRRKRKIAKDYTAHLEGYVRLQTISAGWKSAHNRFAIMLRDEEIREKTATRLHAQRITCSVARNMVAKHASSDWERAMLHHTRQAYDRLLLLPVEPQFTSNTTAHIANQVLEAILNNAPDFYMIKA